jgi:hypothetical protein
MLDFLNARNDALGTSPKKVDSIKFNARGLEKETSMSFLYNKREGSLINE